MAKQLVLGLMLVAFTATASFAQFESDSDEPIEITSDTMEWMNEERVAIARGNADAVQGRYKLHADVLTAFLSQGEDNAAGKIRMITADGNVSLTTPEESARGETGQYDVEKGVVELNGSVVLTQGPNVLRGDKLVMDLNSGRSTLESQERVQAIFSPNNKPAPEEGQ